MSDITIGDFAPCPNCDSHNIHGTQQFEHSEKSSYAVECENCRRSVRRSAAFGKEIDPEEMLRSWKERPDFTGKDIIKFTG